MEPLCRAPGLGGGVDRAAPADVFATLALVRADAAILRHVASHPAVLRAAVGRPPVRAVMAAIEGRSAAAVRALGDFLDTLDAARARTPALTDLLVPFIEQVTDGYFQADANRFQARAHARSLDAPPMSCDGPWIAVATPA